MYLFRCDKPRRAIEEPTCSGLRHRRWAQRRRTGWGSGLKHGGEFAELWWHGYGIVDVHPVYPLLQNRPGFWIGIELTNLKTVLPLRKILEKPKESGRAGIPLRQLNAFGGFRRGLFFAFALTRE